MTKNDEKKDEPERRQSAGAQTASSGKTTCSSSRKSPTTSEPATYRSHTQVDIGIVNKDRPDHHKASFISNDEEEIATVNYMKPALVDRTTFVREKHVSYDDTPEIFHDAADNLDIDKQSTRSKISATTNTFEHRRYFKGPRKSGGGEPTPESSSKHSTSFDSSGKMDPTRPKSNIKNIDIGDPGRRRTLIQYSAGTCCCKCRNCGCSQPQFLC